MQIASSAPDNPYRAEEILKRANAAGDAGPVDDFVSTTQQVVTEHTEADQAQRCSVCEHILSSHDPIGQRFCQATEAHALSRNCICRAAG